MAKHCMAISWEQEREERVATIRSNITPKSYIFWKAISKIERKYDFCSINDVSKPLCDMMYLPLSWPKEYTWYKRWFWLNILFNYLILNLKWYL